MKNWNPSYLILIFKPQLFNDLKTNKVLIDLSIYFKLKHYNAKTSDKCNKCFDSKLFNYSTFHDGCQAICHEEHLKENIVYQT